MPGFLGGGGGGGGGSTGGEISFPKEFVDPVTKFRVSNPENLIDTDFEYGLQPTKWETVELINNTPSFFSKSGDTTIDGIISMTTVAGTREIIVETALDHNLAVGIPINVTGTKSLTADGAFIIASIPNSTTFTYLCKSNQNETLSINDLYTSIVTGEFFQGSQIGIDDSEGILTDGSSTSILTVKTKSTHGFGEKTPLYLLNLNSTISQDFQAANTATRSFDASNSATAQSFDGSNSLSTVSIDLSNSGVESSLTSTVSSVSTTENTITVSHGSEGFVGLTLGTPLYYDVATGAGYFNQNPRGVVFLKSTSDLGASTSTFTVSDLPDGDVISIDAAISGTFQPSDLSRTFAGNNVNPATQTEIQVEVGQQFTFDGGNQGFDGAPPEAGDPPNNDSTVVGYTGDSITVTGDENLNYYVGAMVFYSSTGSAAASLVNNTTYFVSSFAPGGVTGLFTMTITDFPGNPNIQNISGGTGTQTFEKIGISLDKDIVHIKDSNFERGDMLEYTPPTAEGNFVADSEKKFYYVETAYDEHNYALKGELFRPVVATGGNAITEVFDSGRYWRVHQFLSTGTQNLVVGKAGTEGEVQYLIVAGGGGGGMDMGGGGGGGGVLDGTAVLNPGTYPVVVGAGGQGAPRAGTGAGTQGRTGHVYTITGTNGGNSSFNGLTAIGGGRGGMSYWPHSNFRASGQPGGSGGGASGYDTPSNVGGGNGTAGQGNRGGHARNRYYSGGGGGAAQIGGGNSTAAGGAFGGAGKLNSILGQPLYWGGGGGGSGYSTTGGNGGIGGGGGGAVNTTTGGAGLNPGQPGGGGSANAYGNRPGGNGGANTGGGGGGGAHYNATNQGGNGGSGIVVVRYPITAVGLDYVAATGGQITTLVEDGIIYAIHAFYNTGSSTFTVSRLGDVTENNEISCLIVGGGGGGGGYNGPGGGGGAGGVLYQEQRPLSLGSYTIVVGSGGAGGVNTGQSGAHGTKGQNSSAFGLTAFGGGGGNMAYYQQASTSILNGGSGGGGGNRYAISGNGGAATQTSQGGATGYGNNGGRGGAYSAAAQYIGAGGGGAGSVGVAGDTSTNRAYGGAGRAFSITGSEVYYAGGGGGGQGSSSRPRGLGGIGGGGNGGAGVRGSVGASNTGGGGGAGIGGGTGGSGVVIIRYPIGTVQ